MKCFPEWIPALSPSVACASNVNTTPSSAFLRSPLRSPSVEMASHVTIRSARTVSVSVSCFSNSTSFFPSALVIALISSTCVRSLFRSFFRSSAFTGLRRCPTRTSELMPPTSLSNPRLRISVGRLINLNTYSLISSIRSRVDKVALAAYGIAMSPTRSFISGMAPSVTLSA